MTISYTAALLSVCVCLGMLALLLTGMLALQIHQARQVRQWRARVHQRLDVLTHCVEAIRVAMHDNIKASDMRLAASSIADAAKMLRNMGGLFGVVPDSDTIESDGGQLP